MSDKITKYPYYFRDALNAMNHQEVEESVISKIRTRRDKGRTKYGTTMERRDLSTLDWLKHAQEEAMDMAIYLEKLIQIQNKGTENDRLAARERSL